MIAKVHERLDAAYTGSDELHHKELLARGGAILVVASAEGSDGDFYAQLGWTDEKIVDTIAATRELLDGTA